MPPKATYRWVSATRTIAEGKEWAHKECYVEDCGVVVIDEAPAVDEVGAR